MNSNETVVLKVVISELLAKAQELSEKNNATQKLNDVEYGQFLQVLSTISLLQSYLIPYGLKSFGLDFDPDEKYRQATSTAEP